MHPEPQDSGAFAQALEYRDPWSPDGPELMTLTLDDGARIEVDIAAVQARLRSFQWVMEAIVSGTILPALKADSTDEFIDRLSATAELSSKLQMARSLASGLLRDPAGVKRIQRVDVSAWKFTGDVSRRLLDAGALMEQGEKILIEITETSPEMLDEEDRLLCARVADAAKTLWLFQMTMNEIARGAEVRVRGIPELIAESFYRVARVRTYAAAHALRRRTTPVADALAETG